MKSSDKKGPAEIEVEASELLLNTFSHSLRLRTESVRRGEALPEKELIQGIIALLLSMAGILRHQIPNWDSTIINILIDDLTDLSRGANPKFFCKPHSPQNKGVLRMETNEHYAVLHVAIMLLKHTGLSTQEAEALVARRTGLKLSTVVQLHKDFSRSQKSREAMETAERYRQSFFKFSDKRKAAEKLIQFYQSIRR